MSENVSGIERQQGLAVVPKRSWAMLALVLLACMTVPFNMAKCPGLATQIVPYFGVGGSDFGWTMSLTTVLGIALAFPCAGIVNRLGAKNAITISLVVMVFGSILGAVATSWPAFLFSRFIEGFGNSFMGVSGPAAVTAWFPRHKRGIALGIFAPWIPLGTIVMLNIANPLALAFGAFQAAWWVAAAYGVVMLVLWLLFFRMPDKPILDEGEQEPEVVEGDTQGKGADKPLANVSLWLIAISFLFFNLVQNATVNTFYPTYLTQAHGFDAAWASFITSIPSIGAIPMGVVGGWLANRFNTRKWIIVLGYAAIVVSLIWLFNWTAEWQMWVAVLLIAIFPTFSVTNVTAAVPEILSPKNVAVGTAALITLQQAGNFIGSITLGYLYESMGWGLASQITLIPMMLVAIVLVICAKQLR